MYIQIPVEGRQGRPELNPANFNVVVLTEMYRENIDALESAADI